MTEVEQMPQIAGLATPASPTIEAEHIFLGQREAVIKNSDMPEELQADAIELAQQALSRFKLEKEMAAFIKTEFDKKYYPSWQVVVGSNFGSYVTHETHRFTYFYIAHIAFMMYKTGI